MINIEQAIIYLEQNEGLKVPHGYMPNSNTEGTSYMFDEGLWNTYRWNPPQGIPDLAIDAEASPKPEWSTITGVYEKAEKEVLIAAIETALDKAYTEAITDAYGAKDWLDEIFKRLRGDTTPEQDTRRDELRAEAKKEIAKLPTLTLEQLKNYGK